MPTAPSPLHRHLGYWLRRLSNHVSRTFARRLERHGVSVAEWVALRELWGRAPCAQADLLAGIAGDKGGLSRMLTRLVARGLVERRANPASRREVRVSLTAAGRALVPRLAREADENDRAFFATLSARQRAQFSATVKGLIAANGSEALGQPID